MAIVSRRLSLVSSASGATTGSTTLSMECCSTKTSQCFPTYKMLEVPQFITKTYQVHRI